MLYSSVYNLFVLIGRKATFTHYILIHGLLKTNTDIVLHMLHGAVSDNNIVKFPCSRKDNVPNRTKIT